MYIYIYIDREREREGERFIFISVRALISIKDSKIIFNRTSLVFSCNNIICSVYIYIYIYILM